MNTGNKIIVKVNKYKCSYKMCVVPSEEQSIIQVVDEINGSSAHRAFLMHL